MVVLGKAPVQEQERNLGRRCKSISKAAVRSQDTSLALGHAPSMRAAALAARVLCDKL